MRRSIATVFWAAGGEVGVGWRRPAIMKSSQVTVWPSWRA
jgi:hypothetical protein